jgi:hypothetical protein
MRTYDLLSDAGTASRASGRLPGAGIAKFWELRGQRVFESGGVLWGHYRKSIYTSLPFHLQLDPEAAEIGAMLRKARVAGARFPSLSHPGVATGLYVCRPQGYDLNSISRSERKHVRAGVGKCEVRPVDLADLEREGLQLNRETMERQHRFDPEFGEARQWKRLVDAVGQCPEIGVRGAYVGGRLSAYLIFCREDGWIHELYKASRASELDLHTNHVLDYSILCEAGSDPAVRAVGNWYPSSRSDSGLDRYKRNLGFALVPHNLCTQLHPQLAPVLVNKLVIGTVAAAHSKWPANGYLKHGAEVLEAAAISRFGPAPLCTRETEPCQHESGRGYSRPFRPRPVFLVWWYLKRIRQLGILATLRKLQDVIAERAVRRAAPRKAPPKPVTNDEVLALQPGEWVQVKTEAEILATLDKGGKNRGLLFTNEMRSYFGKRLRVFKRVERIYLEESRQNRKLKNTVLLDGVCCTGADMECDKACFLFWKEVWLRRAEPPAEAPKAMKDVLGGST